MKRFALLFAFALFLSACSPSQIAATATRAALPAETVAAITRLCGHAEPFVRLAGAMPIPAAGKEIAAHLGAYCDRMLAGTVPETTDGNTLAWLGDNLAGLRAALGR